MADGSGVPHGESGFLGSAGSMVLPLGSRIDPAGIDGYYVDLRDKVREDAWPPAWLAPPDQQLHVEAVQWGLGAFERHLDDGDPGSLEMAADAGSYLVSIMAPDGALPNGRPMPHTYRLPSPWTSAMAQGQLASLLVRLHKATGDGGFAEAALRALEPMRVPSADGGAMALLDGDPFPEEFPTTPGSFVLNGGIFALWGFLDAGRGLGDERAGEDWERGISLLARSISRYDLGYWSRYDLFPHVVVNVASEGYHALHITQLEAIQIVDPQPEIAATLEAFKGYRGSRASKARAFAAKAAFRLLVPRNPRLARLLPTSSLRR